MAETLSAASESDDDSDQLVSIHEAARSCNLKQGGSARLLDLSDDYIQIRRIYPVLLAAGAALPTSTFTYGDAYLQRVITAGGWANYERHHLDRLTAMLTPKPVPADGPRRSRRRLSPLRRVPPEVLRKIAAFAFHVGYY